MAWIDWYYFRPLCKSSKSWHLKITVDELFILWPLIGPLTIAIMLVVVVVVWYVGLIKSLSSEVWNAFACFCIVLVIIHYLFIWLIIIPAIWWLFQTFPLEYLQLFGIMVVNISWMLNYNLIINWCYAMYFLCNACYMLWPFFAAVRHMKVEFLGNLVRKLMVGMFHCTLYAPYYIVPKAKQKGCVEWGCWENTVMFI